MSEAETYYAHVREKIVHEDDLVNQRQMWMITFNGLLFTAYGFSLGADASSIAALGAAPSAEQLAAFKLLQGTIQALRLALAGVGTLSAIAGLLGVIAAYRAIRDDEHRLARLLRRLRKQDAIVPGLPLVIGRRATNVLGMLGGVLLPFLVAGAWIWTAQVVPDPWVFFGVGAAVAAASGLLIWPLLPRGIEDDA